LLSKVDCFRCKRANSAQAIDAVAGVLLTEVIRECVETLMLASGKLEAD